MVRAGTAFSKAKLQQAIDFSRRAKQHAPSQA
jgi:hypothetical protein